VNQWNILHGFVDVSACKTTFSSKDKLKRLYRLVEDGLTDVDEVLKDRLNTLKADRERAKAALERAKAHSAPQIQIDPALIERFGVFPFGFFGSTEHLSVLGFCTM
jgi:hypothetical protein